MRIVFVTHFAPPVRNAGTETYTLGLAQCLLARGHDVEIVCAEDWEWGETYWNGVSRDEYQDVTVNRIHLNWAKARNPNRILYDSQQAEIWFQHYLAETKPDVVHVTSVATLGVGMLRAVNKAGIPLVLTLMDFWFLCPKTVLLTGEGQICNGRKTAWDCQQCLLTTSGMQQHMRRFTSNNMQRHYWHLFERSAWFSRVRGARGLALNMTERQKLLADSMSIPDVIFSHSKFLQKMFREAGLERSVDYLPNGHELGWLNEYQGKAPHSDMRIGYLGQVSAIKGVHVLIEGFLKADLGDDAFLDIWGNLDHDPQYVQMIRTLIADCDRIKLRGRFDRAQLPQILAEIDILVVPSLWYENAPLVIQEAFATGTPVVATDLGGMAEAVIHEGNGLLFERGSVGGLALQLRRLMDEPDLLGHLRAGIPPVRTVEEEVSELEEHYRKLTEREAPELSVTSG